MRKLFAMLAVLALLLCACGQKEEAQLQAQDTTVPITTAAPTAEPTTEPTEAPTTEPATEPTEPLWKDNIICPTSGATHYDPRPMQNITKYTRNQITEVTFLDTTADMPEDNWDVSYAKDGSVMAWVDTTDGYHMYIAGEGGVAACPIFQESRCLLMHYPNMKRVNFNGAFHTEECTDFGWMFAGCESLEYIDFTGVDTSNVTNMSSMFSECESLESLDLSCFDTSNVTTTEVMFQGCTSLKELNTDGWDTSSITNMECMFEDARSLRELDLSHWDTSSVTNLHSTFATYDNLTTLNVSGWDTSNVTDMSGTFRCAAVTIEGIEDWDVSNVTNMEEMFDGIYLTSLDLSKWDTSKVENMDKMFAYMPYMEQLELGEWEVDSIKTYNDFLLGDHMYKGEHYNSLFQK